MPRRRSAPALTRDRERHRGAHRGQQLGHRVERAEHRDRWPSVDVPALTPSIGGTLFDAGASVIRAEAVCPTGGQPTATVDPLTSVQAGDQTATFDVDGNATVALGAGGGAGTLSLALRTTTTTTTTASAVALTLTFAINDPSGTAVTGTVTIAEASCEAPDVAVVTPTATGSFPLRVRPPVGRR